MSVVTNIGLAVAGVATAAGLVVGPALIDTAPISVTCAEVHVAFEVDNTVRMHLTGCAAGDRPAVVSVSERAPF